jgi:hypothetical protein
LGSGLDPFDHAIKLQNTAEVYDRPDDFSAATLLFYVEDEAYLIGHGGVAVLHHLLGSDVLRRRFWIRRGRRIPVRDTVVSRRRMLVCIFDRPHALSVDVSP